MPFNIKGIIYIENERRAIESREKVFSYLDELKSNHMLPSYRGDIKRSHLVLTLRLDKGTIRKST